MSVASTISMTSDRNSLKPNNNQNKHGGCAASRWSRCVEPVLLGFEIRDDVTLLLLQHAEGRAQVVTLQHVLVVVQHRELRPAHDTVQA